MALVHRGNASNKEKYMLYNTLSGLLKNLENSYTTVDLRNECCLTGKILKVDGFMNIEMEDVIFYDMRGKKIPLTNFYVTSRSIRNVHIPPRKDGLKLLKDQLQCMTRRKTKPSKLSLKTSRAQRTTAETVQMAYRNKEESR